MKLHLDRETQQINLFDKRYYTVKGTDEYYPSATTVLNVFPKGPHFEEWLRQTGSESHNILRKAGNEGTAMHNAIEDALNGKELKMVNDYGDENFSLIVWKMLCRFDEFAPNIKRVIEVEGNSISKKLRIGGTRDLICEMQDGLVYLIDHKSSNHKGSTWPIQLAVYAEMAKECGIHIDRIAILWLKASTRGPAKNKIQGKGWQLLDYTSKWEESLETFGHLRAMFDIANPNYKPLNLTMTNIIKLDIPKAIQEKHIVDIIKADEEDGMYETVEDVMEKPEKFKNKNFRKGTPVYYGGQILYNSIKEAAPHTHFSARKLSKMLHGKTKNTTDLYLEGE